MRRILLGTVASVGLMASMTSAANALVISRTYAFTASQFEDYGPHVGLVAPFETVSGSFTLTFDTAPGDQTDQSVGFVMNGLTMPVTDGFPDDDTNPTIGWTYRSTFDTLAVGGMYQGVATLSKGAFPNNDFYVSINDISTAPKFVNFSYASKSENAFFKAGNISMVITTASAAPEPTSWALMLLGFGGAGSILRRRRKMPAIAA